MSEGVLDPEVARRVSGLRLRAQKAVEGLLAGSHRSRRRGASVVFVEHREYRPGDDPRLLDWRAFARTDRHSIKHFEQETQLRSTLVLDRSGSMAYAGTEDGPSKADHAATLLASVAYILIRQGDAAGLATVDETLGTVLPARSRAAHLERLLGALAEPVVPGPSTDLTTTLDAVAERAGRRGVIAVASDLLDFGEDALRPLASMVTRGNDVFVFHVLDPHEIEFPFHGPTRFTGLEGEPHVDVDPDTVRAAYRREVDAFLHRCRSQCSAAGARYVLARTDEAPETTLAALLASRHGGGWG